MKNNNLIEIKDLKMYFKIKSKKLFGKEKDLKAVDGITLNIKRGETFGLVGESGCGKSTVGRTIARLYEPTEGSIKFDGIEISKLTPKEMKPYRNKIQMIFQDSYSSLDPRMTIGSIIKAPLDIHSTLSEVEKKDKISNLLEIVGLKKEHINRYPHEFSGGQRQRINIARALALNPDFIICDEPISALDVSIQAQIINILEELQEKLGITYLFISHDLSMVKHISHKVGVMYFGSLVEYGVAEEIYKNMKHPYTISLMSAVPIPDPRNSKKQKREILQGDVPNPMLPPSGCPFRIRCSKAIKICEIEKPQLREISSEHSVACHLI